MSNLQRCFRDPIPEIYEAAEYLRRALDFHLLGKRNQASELISKANFPEIREWTESIWGAKSPYINFIPVSNSLPELKKNERVETRMPDKKLKDLKDSGVINEEEFSKLKKRIINDSSKEFESDNKVKLKKSIIDNSSKEIDSDSKESKDAHLIKKKDPETLNEKLVLLRAKLKDDEVIVVKKGSKQARIISKERYGMDKEMGISEDYTVVGRY